jgi:Protein of unknown function (DUF3443)
MNFVNPKFFAGFFFIFLWMGCMGCEPLVSLGSKSLSSFNNKMEQCSAAPLVTLPANELVVTVNGSQCGPTSQQYANEPCVTVTLCQHGNSNCCETIDNILLDTGSTGLRVFSSLVTVPLSNVMQGSAQVAECMNFGDGSSQWGPVVYADVRLNGETASQLPIQLIDQSYGTPPLACTTDGFASPALDPATSFFNGVLGVGVFAQDCGEYCEGTTTNQQYYACTGTNCSEASLSVNQQVSNPISFFATDNNGLLLKLPSIAAGGAPSVNGSLFFGIGTEVNNVPSGVTAYSADSNGEFTTVFSAYSTDSMPSFLDTGSNYLYFPPPTSGALPDCGNSWGSDWSGYFCPAAVQSFSAVNTDATGTNTGSVSFQIQNAYTLLNNGNADFTDVGATVLSGEGATAQFDFGLPFFYGRSVYVGFATSSLGSGSYWAY